MRLTLSDLFVVTAFCAVMSWCAAQIGVENPSFWISVALSAVISTICVFSANKKLGWLLLLIPGAIGGFCLLPVGSLALLINMGLLAVAGVVSGFLPRRSVRFWSRVAMICMASSFIAGSLIGLAEVRKLKLLRAEFPIVSLNERLTYEKGRPDDAQASLTPASVKVTTQLNNREQELDDYAGRNWQLRRLHDQEYEKFVRALGLFGVSRMPRVTQDSLRKAPLKDIPFDQAADSDAGDSLDRDYYRSWRVLTNRPKVDSLDGLHRIAEADFLDPEGFGAIFAPVTKIAGFIDHAVHGDPAADIARDESWMIRRLELVSLLRFPEPRVYVIGHMPRMDQLSSDSVETRPLDSFEASALKRLDREEDVIVLDHGGDARMLGSLRAATQCLDCHNVQRGDLLGAFSYVLSKQRRAE